MRYLTHADFEAEMERVPELRAVLDDRIERIARPSWLIDPPDPVRDEAARLAVGYLLDEARRNKGKR